jgi:8-oxo-dGTP pyrophosphatase MutT (NUDIX family)
VKLRRGVRGLVVDPDDRIVLVRFDHPDRTVWAAPGGGIEQGEDDAATLARELREELGLALPRPLGRHVWERTHVFPMGEWDGQTERFYVVRVPSFDIAPALGWDGLRTEGVSDIRWWTLEDLDSARVAVFAPRDLPALLRALLEGGSPTEPLDVGV